jgi:hypothetical protein
MRNLLYACTRLALTQQRFLLLYMLSSKERAPQEWRTSDQLVFQRVAGRRTARGDAQFAVD